MNRKIIKIGTSAGVTIPGEALERLGLRVGDGVIVEVDNKSKSLRIKRRFKVDKEIVDWTDDFIEKYRPALEELAKK